MKEQKRHFSLQFGCPVKKDCSNGLRVEKGKHICDCGKDFTKEIDSFSESFLNSNKDKEMTDIKNNIEYEISYDDAIGLIDEWDATEKEYENYCS